ncbi:two-component sensor histidine kinase [Streptomyces sp. TS71-3]|nr:two-component sensor histidine kinase [Streptomyces sp. TS71-3]
MVRRFAILARTGVGTLRGDLWTADAAPLTRGGRRRWRPALSNPALVLVGIVLFAINWNRYFFGYGLGAVGILIVAGQASVLPLALRRPIPAWWISPLSQAALAAAWFAPRFSNASGWQPNWSGLELAMQAWALFHVALRHRPRVAAEALALSVLGGLLFVVVWDYGGYVTLTVAVLAISTLLGALLRGRKVARDQLTAQEERTAEERARRTLLEERARIARELHDVVAHHMSVISIQAQAAPHLVENPSAELRENLANIHQNAKDALTELRQVLGVLRSERTEPVPDLHAPQPTLDRLGELLANVRGAGLGITVHTTGTPVQLAQGVELSAFRIVQEAVSNAIRHAPGAKVRVDVEYGSSELTVRVRNTAPDRPAAPSSGAGHGLLGISERAAMLGGTVAFGATAGGGYEVTAMLPAKLPAGVDPVEDTA